MIHDVLPRGDDTVFRFKISPNVQGSLVGDPPRVVKHKGTAVPREEEGLVHNFGIVSGEEGLQTLPASLIEWGEAAILQIGVRRGGSEALQGGSVDSDSCGH